MELVTIILAITVGVIIYAWGFRNGVKDGREESELKHGAISSRQRQALQFHLLD